MKIIAYHKKTNKKLDITKINILAGIATIEYYIDNDLIFEDIPLYFIHKVEIIE